MTAEDIKPWVVPFIFLLLGGGAAVFVGFLIQFSIVKRRFRKTGLSRGNAKFLFEMRGAKNWRTVSPVLALAVVFWPKVTAEETERFLTRMDAFKESLDPFWLPMSVSIAHDVRTAIEAGEPVATAQEHADLLEETLPHVEDLAEYGRFVMEFGLVNASQAMKDGLPLDYARAMYPPAPTFAAPLSKQEYLQGEYTPRDIFQFKEGARV